MTKKLIIGAIAFIVIVMGYFAATGRLGTVHLEPTEIGVKVNYVTGSYEILKSSGTHTFFPIISRVHKLDSSPQKFVMAGDKNVSANHVRKLTVRAKDGSNFYFDEIEIQYKIIPEKADIIVKHSGLGDSYKEKWLKPYSRKVLRDEFGRYSSEEIANPTQYGSAKQKSSESLNKVLQEKGIKIIDISTPKPRFDPIYEKTIEARINADQEVEKQKVKREKLTAEMEYRIKKIINDKQIEYQNLEGELKRQLIDAEKELYRVKKNAEAYKIQQIGVGEAEKAELMARSKAKKIQYRKDAEALEEKTNAMAQQGDAIIYKILAEKYKNMNIELQPYSIDANPQRVQIENVVKQ